MYNEFEGFPPPTAFGLPLHFSKWRGEQLLAIDRTIKSAKRFTCHALPTGAGKSLVGIATALMAGWRVIYLTSTKGLQDQLRADFDSIGLVDIRGQGNYPCKLLNETDYSGMCDHGPCHAGFPCDYRASGCFYYDWVKKAKVAQLVTTNYAYWIRINRFAELTEDGRPKDAPLGKRDLLVMDEIHNAPNELSEAMSFSFNKQETDGILGIPSPWDTTNLETWIAWTQPALIKIDKLLESTADRVKAAPYSALRREFKRLKDIKRKLIDLYTCRGEWIAFITKGHTITFSPLWPRDYLQNLALRSIPRVVGLSATVRPKTAYLLGVGDKDLDFYDYDSSFPTHLRPVIHVPTVRMNHRTSDEELRTWLDRIDQIIRKRQDRKGIIHSVSYDRRNLIIMYSKYRNIMLSHDSKNAVEVVRRFKDSSPPAVLVSPSMSTGWDFPMDDCRFQIISKLAFLDTRNALANARCIADPDYSPYVAMQDFIQACGRGVRSREDWCECVAPETRILTKDLRWVPAYEFCTGDPILAFNENCSNRSDHRLWEHAVTVKASTRIMPRVRVMYEDGQLICTPNHPLLSLTGNGRIGWCRADQLVTGDCLVRFMYPWTDNHTYGGGWLSGMFDGKGTYCPIESDEHDPDACTLCIKQEEGDIAVKLATELTKSNFCFYTLQLPDGQLAFKIRGGFSETTRFLGSIRPPSLLDKFSNTARREKLTAIAHPKILAVEALTDGDITSLQTSSGTFVSEGLGSHNSFILDDNVAWFMKKYKTFAPRWFLQSMRKEVTVPDPPALSVVEESIDADD